MYSAENQNCQSDLKKAITLVVVMLAVFHFGKLTCYKLLQFVQPLNLVRFLHWPLASKSEVEGHYFLFILFDLFLFFLFNFYMNCTEWNILTLSNANAKNVQNSRSVIVVIVNELHWNEALKLRIRIHWQQKHPKNIIGSQLNK